MINVSQKYITALSDPIRERGEMTVVWTVGENTITLTNEEFSQENGIVYESFMNPNMTELPYTKMSFSFVDEDGDYDPQNPESNISSVVAKQQVVLKYKQFFSDGTSEEFIVDTVYTTGEVQVSEKIVTVYCQDILSFDEADSYVEDVDDNYTYGVLSPRSYYDLINLVVDKLDDVYTGVVATISDTTLLQNTNATLILPKDLSPTILLQMLTNAIGYEFKSYGMNLLIRANTTGDSHPFQLTTNEILGFPTATSDNAIRQMTVYYYNYAVVGDTLNLDSEITLTSSQGNYYHVHANSRGDEAFLFNSITYNDSKADCVSVDVQQKDPYACQVDAVLYLELVDGESFSVDNIAVIGNLIQKLQRFDSYPMSPSGYGENKSLDNPFITDALRARAIAVNFYNSASATDSLTFQYGGEPSIQVGDKVVADTEYETGVNFVVSRQALIWNGALNGTVELIRERGTT